MVYIHSVAGQDEFIIIPARINLQELIYETGSMLPLQDHLSKLSQKVKKYQIIGG